MINHDAIAKLLPHGESMCLIDFVVSWDDEEIACNVDPILGIQNVFGSEGLCSPILLIEHGAQAAGIHAALSTKKSPDQFRLQVMGVAKQVVIFHTKPLNLASMTHVQVHARQQLHSSDGVIYSISASIKEGLLIQATLVLKNIV